jgi:hypothetical protein
LGVRSWSHYADGHRGIALHFESRKPPFQLTWQVTYSRDYPQIVAGGLRSADENWRRLRQALLVKDTDWAYEEEYRFFAPQTEQSADLLRRFDVTCRDGFLYVPQSTIVGVTLGAKMPAEARDELLDFLKANRPDIAVRRAQLARARFEVEVVNA